MSYEDEELDELLALVNHEGPLPGDTEDRLLDELHASLARGPLEQDDPWTASDGESTAENVNVVVLSNSDGPEPRTETPSRLPWLAAAAAAIAVLIVVAVFLDDDTTTEPVSQPSPAALPVITDMAQACERFSASTPDRAELVALVASEDSSAADELTRVLAALAALQRDLREGTELTDQELQSLELAEASFQQAALRIGGNQLASGELDKAHEQLRLLGDTHSAFSACRSY